jgi:hypothetical protein
VTLRDLGGLLFSGVGRVIPEVMLLGLGTWGAGYMLRGIGKGQFVELLNILAVFVAFGITFVTVIAEATKAFNALGL